MKRWTAHRRNGLKSQFPSRIRDVRHVFRTVLEPRRLYVWMSKIRFDLRTMLSGHSCCAAIKKQINQSLSGIFRLTNGSAAGTLRRVLGGRQVPGSFAGLRIGPDGRIQAAQIPATRTPGRGRFVAGFRGCDGTARHRGQPRIISTNRTVWRVS